MQVHPSLRIFIGTALVAACVGGVSAQMVKVNGYRTIVEGYDWGPGVSKLILEMGQPISAAFIDKGDFTVQAVRKVPGTGEIVKAMNWATMTPYDSKGERKVIDAYLSNAKGEKVPDTMGTYVTIAMEVGPDIELASPLNFDLTTFLNSYVDIEHTIVIRGGLMSADTVVPPSACKGTSSLIADDFDVTGVTNFNDDRYGKITLHYASYTPARDGKKHPLVIWLHGAGEGGTNPYIALLGNRVTRLASDPIQNIMGGAYVLVPQSPIVWMNNGVKSYPEDGSTQYTKALKACIDTYIAKTPGIDPKRVYIGGCSNGGYMTMNMILSYPHFFTAAFPICETYSDAWISDDQIASIKDLPIWFTQAKSDTTVKAAQGGFVLETYKRLIASGGKDIHLSYWDKVEDLSISYFKADGKTPYEYNGHWSWIYTLDNQCTKDFDGSTVKLGGKDTTIFEWLSAQSR
jgi:predicted peptidase